MSEGVTRRALLSVSDKAGLAELGAALAARGVELVSTGGTAKALRDAGLTVKDVSELTGFPEMMDGRVKTLHPTVHGGLLALRDNAEHVAAMQAHGIGAIDLVVVNLYPFEARVAKGASREEIIEKMMIEQSAELLARKGEMAIMKGDRREALSCWGKALELRPNSPEYREGMERARSLG